MITRRAALLGGLAVVAGCSATPPAAPRSTAPRPTARPAPELAELERRFGGRLGVFAVDTGSGATVGHRADERFLMCSTFKALAVAATLRLRDGEPGLLDRVIHYDTADLLEYAPIAKQHVAEGMTVASLCDATITYSDNTAANLLLEILGGPAAVTGFVRGLGDDVTRLDRIEPDLNVTTPGDERDTTTPAAITTTLRALTLGDGLDQAGRELLVGWLKANTTGDESIRAGLPAGWQVGDKTGSGAQGEVNDVAVAWPPNRAPLVIAVYTAPADPNTDQGRPTVAAAAKIVASTLVP
jgi:beta-lactamase class A